MTRRRLTPFRSLAVLAAVLCLPLLSGCSTMFGDSALNLKRQDYADLAEPPAEDGTAENASEAADIPPFEAEPPVPDLVEPLAAPPVPLIPNNRLITVSVNDTVPLKDVLFEMARQARVDIEIDPRIAGGVNFTARDRPFLDVIDRIADLAGLRWTVNDGSVRVEVDDPYAKSYRLPQINIRRSITSQSFLSTGLNAGEGNASGTGSTIQIQNEQATDIYATLLVQLKDIIEASNPPGYQSEGDEPVSLNPQAGVVSVFGNSEQHAAVENYLTEVARVLGSQVLIEGRIIEVSLNEGSATGINWDSVLQKSGIGEISFNTPFIGGGNIGNTTSTNPVTFSVVGSDASAIVRVVEEYGNVRLLSSPRVTVVNNQIALIKVAENFVYFDLDAEVEQDRNNEGQAIGEVQVVFNSDIQSIPIGFNMAVQPAIDLDNNDVTLSLRPSVTQISDFVSDPAFQATLDQFGGNLGDEVDPRIPIVDIREIESVLKLRSGEVAVLGGLMQQRATLNRRGIPKLRALGLVGKLFGSEEETSELVELVILLRATIVPSAAPDAADRRLYRRYVRDPRPIGL